MSKNFIFVCCIGFLLTGCSLAPKYKKPQMETPDIDKSVDIVYEELYKKFGGNKWWKIFNDENLNAIEERALSSNGEMKNAISKIKIFELAHDSAMSTIFSPNIDFTSDIKKAKMSAKGIYPINANDREKSLVSSGLSASYEIDLFGKNLAQSKVAYNELLASKMAKEALFLSLTASVAKAYFSYIAMKEKISIANRTLETRKSTFDMYKSRFENGYCNELDFNRVKADLHNAETTLAKLEDAFCKIETALCTLIGESPKDIINPSIAYKNINNVDLVDIIPSSIPSDLLQRRPDIEQAEEELRSYNERIGVAKAAFLPSFLLTSSIGFESSALQKLTTNTADTWLANLGVSLPIFNGGRLIMKKRIAEEQYKQSVENYKHVVRNAFKEAKDSIVSNVKWREIVASTTDTKKALERSYILAIEKHKTGLIGLIDLLDVERNFLVAQLDQVDALQNLLNSIVDLCKSIGGGWKMNKRQ